MALSDWSSIAFDKDGKLTKSLLEIKDKKKKSSVEVRKNWIRINDENTWCDAGGFDFPVVAVVKHGDVSISHFEVIAKRGRQNSVFVFVKYYAYDKRLKDTLKEMYFAAIGCYAYKGSKEVGIEQKTFNDFKI